MFAEGHDSSPHVHSGTAYQKKKLCGRSINDQGAVQCLKPRIYFQYHIAIHIYVMIFKGAQPIKKILGACVDILEIKHYLIRNGHSQFK